MAATQSYPQSNLIGVGLRPTHYPYLETHQELEIGWFEAISENYMDSRGRPFEMLQSIRERFPVALHGVSMSIASPQGVGEEYLRKLKRLVDIIEPFIVSDHLCWTRADAHSLHDLLPFRYDDDALQVVCENVQRVQDTLQRQLQLENISAYLAFNDNFYSEPQFLRELVQRTGCGLLFDVNNLYVNAVNYGFDPDAYVADYPLSHVGQMHLAGHTDTGKFLFDTHSAPVTDRVWALFGRIAPNLPGVPVLLEWDDQIPEFEVVQAEALKAAAFLEHVDQVA